MYVATVQKKVGDGGQNYVNLLADLDDINPETARRLNKIERAGEDVTPLVRAYKNGDIDGNDLRRASKLLDNTNKEYISSGDITINELLDIADKNDLDDVHVVVKDTDGDVRPLLQGRYNPDDTTKDSGWVYIKGRHIHGEQMDDPKKGATDFFPMGQEIKGRNLEPANEMKKKDIKRMAYQAVKNSDTDRQDRITYDLGPKLESRTGVSKIRVVIRNGHIRQVYPKTGDAVHKWIQQLGKWEDELESN
ncbi:hypothetical protein [Halorussus sp. MSC15.2]|uniref:hypothetical protein n=1 Tax=Halorussus sp. MSC15.2 TaxID=2283638 RepID=UPI0013D14653|nr:hypothetical protein [Halorussus sp. MSC15.2]NEU59201.1 hypothetical protein [Halorussus sp. MSC15.2]